MSYRRVTPEDRLLIKAFLDLGLFQSEIACKLGFTKVQSAGNWLETPDSGVTVPTRPRSVPSSDSSIGGV